jgi:hypothetical protein
MSFELVERLPLGRFSYEPCWTPLFGAYIYPLRLFANDRSYDPNDYLEVVRVENIAGTDVAITRGGGLFVRDRLEGRLDAETTENISGLFNLILCELTLLEFISQPFTDADIHSAKLIGRHASILGGWGYYADRTWGPFSLLAAERRDLSVGYSTVRNYYWPPNFYWRPHPAAVLSRLNGASRALKLKEISQTLPALVVAASFHASRRNQAETILTAWIACEEILSHLWEQRLSKIADRARRERLKDSRTYSASVQAEVLLTGHLLDEPTYKIVQEARKIRNDMAHGSKMSSAGAATCLEALRSMLSSVGVATDFMPYQTGYGYIGRPVEALEPEFRFD